MPWRPFLARLGLRLSLTMERAGFHDLALVPEAELGAVFPDCVPGAVPAAGLAYGVETALDEALAGLANVYFEGADHRHLAHVGGDAFRTLLAGARLGRFSPPGHQQGNG